MKQRDRGRADSHGRAGGTPPGGADQERAAEQVNKSHDEERIGAWPSGDQAPGLETASGPVPGGALLVAWDRTSERKGRRVLLIVLPLIVLACLALWYGRNIYRVQFAQMTRV